VKTTPIISDETLVDCEIRRRVVIIINLRGEIFYRINTRILDEDLGLLSPQDKKY